MPAVREVSECVRSFWIRVSNAAFAPAIVACLPPPSLHLPCPSQPLEEEEEAASDMYMYDIYKYIYCTHVYTIWASAHSVSP